MLTSSLLGLAVGLILALTGAGIGVADAGPTGVLFALILPCMAAAMIGQTCLPPSP